MKCSNVVKVASVKRAEIRCAATLERQKYYLTNSHCITDNINPGLPKLHHNSETSMQGNMIDLYQGYKVR